MQLVLIAGDQLSPHLSSLRACDPRQCLVVMAELPEEAGYVRHHKKKIAFLFSAMRHFARELQEQGYTVHYHAYATHTLTSFEEVLAHHLARASFDAVVLTEFGEWRLQERAQGWSERLGLPVRILADDRFLCDHESFAAWAKGRKSLRMEYFYRDMRKRTGLLMDGDQPAGGKWNFDADNRSGFDVEMLARLPAPPAFEADDITREVIALVAAEFDTHPGQLEGFGWGVTRAQAEQAWRQFLADGLPDYGRYQDAMGSGQPFLFHAVCALYLNCGLLEPLRLCQDVEAAWREGRVAINAAEGFIRQIIGWREFVRGIYWLKMPEYATRNHFAAHRALPQWYWTADTRMHCLSEAIGQTLEHAYAHHIQRLMITGNFALLAGLDVEEVCAWYLAVYADAYEWVELPNTLGMALFADGGMFASKPYAASGKYIHRMSDYCRPCSYKVTDTTGDQACPFNALYWHFLERERPRLEGNPRMGMMYRNLDKWSEEKRAAVFARGDELLERVESL